MQLGKTTCKLELGIPGTPYLSYRLHPRGSPPPASIGSSSTSPHPYNPPRALTRSPLLRQGGSSEVNCDTSRRHGQEENDLENRFLSVEHGKVVPSVRDGPDGISFVVLRGSVVACELDRWSVGGSLSSVVGCWLSAHPHSDPSTRQHSEPSTRGSLRLCVSA